MSTKIEFQSAVSHGERGDKVLALDRDGQLWIGAEQFDKEKQLVYSWTKVPNPEGPPRVEAPQIARAGATP